MQAEYWFTGWSPLRNEVQMSIHYRIKFANELINLILFYIYIFLRKGLRHRGRQTFWTNGPHSVLTRFQRAAIISADQKTKVFAGNLGLFSGEPMAKTIKNRFSVEIQAFFRMSRWRRPQKRFLPGDENHFGDLLLHIYNWKKIKGREPDDNERSQPGKLPWRAASGLRAVGCRPLVYEMTSFTLNLFIRHDEFYSKPI